VRIYSASGTLVRTVFRGVARKRVLKVSWDGRNRYRQLVRSGRYQVRITASGKLGRVELSRRFVVRRAGK
jgi:flagellar hook assembly protein FlgD